MIVSELFEDQPSRLHDAGVIKWLEDVHTRPDIDDLYLHGSRKNFAAFNQPNVANGQLIFMSKFTGENQFPDRALQAEYYGNNLYLLKVGKKKMFSPRNDPVAHRILADALPENCYGREDKLKYGSFDYQDCYEVVPPACEAGYNFFRIYEVSMRGFSYGAADPTMIQIVDKYEAPDA